MNNSLKSHFLLRDDITFLNFGSFGATPKSVFERYQAYQRELEAGPVQFIVHDGYRYIEQSRKDLAAYINCDYKDVVYVTNPSYAVNAIARSLNLKKDDEVLSTDLEYGACDRTWDYYCNAVGAKYIRQNIPLPIIDKNHFVENFAKGISSKTKLIFLSHITSSTALLFPVEEICDLAHAHGIPIFIDGAHAPGQVPLDLIKLNPDYYTGACHKWMMAPKGSAFLYVAKNNQPALDPIIISWGYKALFPTDAPFIDHFQFNGTRDYSAFLCTQAAIDFMNEHDWNSVSASCRKLVLENAPKLLELLGTEAISPISDDFMVQMFAAEIKTTEPEKLYRHIVDTYKIEIPISRHGSKNYIRYSINGFNEQSDLDKLFNALEDIKKHSSFIA